MATTSSLIVDLLAERPTHELERMREQARETASRLQVEMDQIEEALAKQARSKQVRRPSRQGTGSGSTGAKAKILEMLSTSAQPLSPAEIERGLAGAGIKTTRGAIHTALGRAMKAGQVKRVAEGRYTAASSGGDSRAATTGHNQNGAETLSFAATPQEGS